MLFYGAVLRKERRDRRIYVLDAAVAELGGKAVNDHLARLKD